MQKQKENVFHEKFSLLNSQEHSEDIKWSSSSSSDYENTCNNDRFCNLSKNLNQKRKRKRKVPKNVSNLDITIIDANTEDQFKSEKSPILITKSARAPVNISPILSSKFPTQDLKITSPILSNKSFRPRSPILTQKGSPKLINVKKKLRYNHEATLVLKSKFKMKEIDKEDRGFMTNKDNSLIIKEENIGANDSILINTYESNSITNQNDSDSSLKARLNLTEKVKNFFDSHFSSETTSQNISESQTPDDSSKTDETIEILSCKTQNVFNNVQSIKKEISINSDSSSFLEKSNKKIKYKKGGLAHRLNILLKKQNAALSLWQHERFLATNSNFVIPKEENIVFRIQYFNFKYGCYLIEAVDVNCQKHLIVLNKMYVKNNIKEDYILKIYEPYRISSINEDIKIVTNVCKFECIDINNK